MINRVLIRIRIVQILYSCYQNQDGSLKKAENDLFFSFQKSYDLYFYFFQLLIDLTDSYSKKIEANKSKLLPTHEDLNPNVHLLNNKFIKQLKANETFVEYIEDRPMSWEEHDIFLKNLLNDILASDTYKEYAEVENPDYEMDREFWRKIFKQIICRDEELYSLLEDESIFWNDDIEIVASFILKTIKKFEESAGDKQRLLPMFKDEEDRDFAIKLLRESMLNVKSHRDMINESAQNWESERIAFMDMIIMQTAISEIMSFASIPINVSLNEYIDIAKSYSTEKSASFINGILDSIVKQLRENKRLLK